MLFRSVADRLSINSSVSGKPQNKVKAPELQDESCNSGVFIFVKFRILRIPEFAIYQGSIIASVFSAVLCSFLCGSLCPIYASFSGTQRAAEDFREPQRNSSFLIVQLKNYEVNILLT